MHSPIRYIKPLDGIRATAALMVIIFHFFQNVSFTDPIGNVIQKLSLWGQTGVSLFFVLSGFLITRILLHAKEGNHYFKNFFIRRSLRIFPLYFLYLCIFYFVLPIFKAGYQSDFSQQWYYWFYLQDFSRTFGWGGYGPVHFWSLAVEEHFYLFWPLIVYYLPNKHFVKVIISLMLIAPICRFFLTLNGYETFFFTFARMDELALGALLAHWEMNNQLKTYHRRYFFLGTVSIGLLAALLWVKFSGAQNFWMQVIKYDFISLIYFCLIGWMILLDENHWLSRFFSNRIFVFLGSISYGLYVYQGITLPLTWNLVPSHYPLIIHFSFTMISTVLISYLSFKFIEKPITALKSKFQYS